jgi:hypothetical protein
MSREWEGYASYIARALKTPGGHLSIGRAGFTLHYEHGRLSGYDNDRVKREAIAAGLPVIDSREAPYDLLAKLVVKGPMIAVGETPSPRPWHGFSYAPLADVAAAYRAIGAEVHNLPDAAPDTLMIFTQTEGSLGELLDGWLAHCLQQGA